MVVFLPTQYWGWDLPQNTATVASGLAPVTFCSTGAPWNSVYTEPICIYIKAHFCFQNTLLYKNRHFFSSRVQCDCWATQPKHHVPSQDCKRAYSSFRCSRYIRINTYFFACSWEKLEISQCCLLACFPLPPNFCVTMYWRAVPAHLARVFPKHRAFHQLDRKDFGLPGCKILHFRGKTKKTKPKKASPRWPDTRTWQLQRI